MASKKLPVYFKEYLDEKFMHVFDNINDVKDEVTFVKKELERMNGSVSDVKKDIANVRTRSKYLCDKYIPKYEETEKMAERNKKIIIIGGFVLVLVIVLVARESDGDVMKAVWSTLAGLL